MIEPLCSMYDVLIVIGEDYRSLLAPYCEDDEDLSDNDAFCSFKWDSYCEIENLQTNSYTQYGRTIRETEWEYEADVIESMKCFWHEWVEQNDTLCAELKDELERKYGFPYNPAYYLKKYQTLDRFIDCFRFKTREDFLLPDGTFHRASPDLYHRLIRHLPADTPVHVINYHY